MSLGASPDAPAEPARRWFDKPATAPETRLPALDDALAAVGRAWAEGFARLSAVPGEVALLGVSLSRVDRLLARRGPGAFLATLEASSWDTLVAVTFDRAFVSAVVEALFGGTGEDAPEDRGGTPPSPVELRIAEVVARQTAEALAIGFAEVLPTPFQFLRLQPKLDAGVLGKPATPLLVATLTLATLGRRVELDIVLPQPALAAFGDRLAGPAEATATADPAWTEQLETEVSRATVDLTATLDMPAMTLGALTRLRVGQVLALPPQAGRAVLLACEGDALFRCELGQSGGHYTVRVEEAVTRPRRKPR